MLHLGYTTFTYKTRQKNKTVKKGGLVLKIMHNSCETNLPVKMAAGLKSLLITFSKKSMLFQDFFVRLESPLKLKYLKILDH